MTLELQKSTRMEKPANVVQQDEANADSFQNHDIAEDDSREEKANVVDPDYNFTESSPGFKNSVASNATESNEKARNLPNTTVDFDAALNQLLTSIDEIQFPVRKSLTPTKKQPSQVSLNDVYTRLQELQNEKERLRKMLLSQI